MKILYLSADLGIPVLGRKGASVHVRSLVAALGRAGHSVAVATPSRHESPWEDPARLEASLLHLPPGAAGAAACRAVAAFDKALRTESSLPRELQRLLYNQDLLRQLLRRFEGEPPDFIYERASLYTIAGVCLARELKVPLLVELNAPLALEQSTYRAPRLGELAAEAERWTLRGADAVLVVSAALRDHAASLGVVPERIHVVPNGVDAALFRPGTPDPEVRARWELGNGPILGFVGGLRPWHGVDALPRLLDRLARRYPELRLVIAGEGPRRSELERELRERGLMRSVRLTGSVPHEEVAELIRQFDVALAPYPSLQHPFYFSPLKLFEYMACGVPVVAADVGQIGEVVRDGETGLLYPADDLDALTAACDRLLAAPSLRRRLGEAAAQEIHARYTWDQNAARVTELARGLIAAPQNRRSGGIHRDGQDAQADSDSEENAKGTERAKGAEGDCQGGNGGPIRSSKAGSGSRFRSFGSLRDLVGSPERLKQMPP